MRVRFNSYFLVPPALLLLALMVACAGVSDAPPPAAAPDAPPAQAATPLPASARAAMDQFVQQQQEIEVDWDKYHQDFDQWRAGLTSCHRSSVQAALRDFAVSFNSVTEQTRDLPRNATTRELADILIEAAVQEEAAYRQLRDRWQPKNVSLFEQVEQRRADAALAQKMAEDQAIDLQKELEEGADPEEVAAVEAFSEALDGIKDQWKEFHADYADLRKEADELDNAVVITRLEQLLEQLSSITSLLEGISSEDATEDMIGMLQDAAQGELEALLSVAKSLADSDPPPPSVDPSGIPIPTATPIPPPDSEKTGPAMPPGPPGMGMGMESAPGASFDEMDIAVSYTEDVLRQVKRSIKVIVDDSPAESLANVREFNNDYRRLLEEWNAFHQGYDDWRKTDGGCDRTSVVEALDQFNLRANDLGRQVRDLPQASYLLPMYTLLVEAAEREEGAIRALRNSWQPFTVDVFKAVDQERVHANRLRRQADIGLQELSERF